MRVWKTCPIFKMMTKVVWQQKNLTLDVVSLLPNSLPMSISALSLAQSLLRCPSISPDDAGAIDVLITALKPLSFACHILTFPDESGVPVRNLFARYGTGAPYVLFAGHVDVVPVGREADWSHPPFAAEIADGVLYGRGACDMKTSSACFAAAAEGFLKNNPAFAGSIGMLATSDEELSGHYGTEACLRWMEDNGHIPDVCLVGEPTSANTFGDTIKIGRRGSINFHLDIQGKQGHAAYPHLADNPATPLVRILEELTHSPLDEGTPDFPLSSLQITTIDIGNTVTNLIPARASAAFNVRFNTQHTCESLTEWVQSVVDKHAKGKAAMKIGASGNAFLTKRSPWVDTVAAAVQQVAGVEPTLNTTGGTSDARYISRYCPVLEFGPLSQTIHQVDERIPLADIEKLTSCYRAILDRYYL